MIGTQREHSANILEAPKSYAQQDPPKPMNVITMDCRGLEFVEFKADVRTSNFFFSLMVEPFLTLIQGEWKATGLESGTQFSGIDLTDGEWFDYDEKAGEEVSITTVKWEIRRA